MNDDAYRYQKGMISAKKEKCLTVTNAIELPMLTSRSESVLGQRLWVPYRTEFICCQFKITSFTRSFATRQTAR